MVLGVRATGRLQKVDREAHKSTSFQEADGCDKEQQWAITPDERMAIAQVLRERFYGKDAPDVREAERSKHLDDLDHLTRPRG